MPGPGILLLGPRTHSPAPPSGHQKLTEMGPRAAAVGRQKTRVGWKMPETAG